MMKVPTPDIEKSFKTLVAEGLLASFTWTLGGIAAFTTMIYLVRYPEHGSGFIGSRLTFLEFCGVTIVVLIADAMLGAAYVYARVRNPRYIRKELEYERSKVKKSEQSP